MKNFKTTAFVLIAALAALALAQDTFTLKRAPKTGDEHRFRIEMRGDFGGQSLEFTGIAIERVVRVEEDGTFHVEMAQEDTKVKFGESEFDVPPSPPETTVISADGLIKEIKGEEEDPSAYRIGIVTLTPAPENPVKTGDKWTHTYKADGRTGAVAAKASFEVLGTERWRTFDTVRIKVDFEETEGDERMTATSTVWLDVRDFSVVRTESDIKNAPIPGAPEPVDLTLKIERI
jgi:hypothetical protein